MPYTAPPPQPLGSRAVSADLPSYQHLYDNVLISLPGVRGLSSTIVMKQAVGPRPLPDRPPRAAR